MSEKPQMDVVSLISAEKKRAAELIAAEKALQKAAARKKVLDVLNTKDTDTASYKSQLERSEYLSGEIESDRARFAELDQFVQENGGIEKMSDSFKAAYDAADRAQKVGPEHYDRYVITPLEKITNKLDDIPADVDRKELTPEWFLKKFEEVALKAPDRVGEVAQYIAELQLDPATQERVIQKIDLEIAEKESKVNLEEYQKWKVLRDQIMAAMPTAFDGSRNLWIGSIFNLEPNYRPGWTKEHAVMVHDEFLDCAQNISVILDQISKIETSGFLGKLGIKKKEIKTDSTDYYQLEQSWFEMYQQLKRHGLIKDIPKRLSGSINTIKDSLEKTEATLRAEAAVYGLVADNDKILQSSKLPGYSEVKKVLGIKTAWETSSAPLRKQTTE